MKLFAIKSRGGGTLCPPLMWGRVNSWEQTKISYNQGKYFSIKFYISPFRNKNMLLSSLFFACRRPVQPPVLGHCPAQFHVWLTGFVFCRSQWLAGFQSSIVNHIQKTSTNCLWPVQNANYRISCPALTNYLFQALTLDKISIKSSKRREASGNFQILSLRCVSFKFFNHLYEIMLKALKFTNKRKEEKIDKTGKVSKNNKYIHCLLLFLLNAPDKLFWPHPPREPPGTSLFFFFALVLLSPHFFLVPPYVITKFTLFSSSPPFFIAQTFLLTPELPGGRDGDRRIWPAHKVGERGKKFSS